MSSELILPADIYAEKTILGAILLDNSSLYEAAETLSPEDFSLDSHRRIFERMWELSETGSTIDAATLPNLLFKYKEIESVGGVPYIWSLTEGLPMRPVIRDYIRIVRDKALLRRVMAISTAAMSRASEQTDSAVEVIGSTVEALDDAIASQRSHARSMEQILPAAAANFERVANLPLAGLLGAHLFTGAIDEATHGIHPTELCLIAARPGQGKTEAALQVAIRNARQGLRVHIQTLEMKQDPLLWRLWRLMAKVPIRLMRDPRCLGPQHRQAIRQAQEELADLPIQIDDTHELTIAEFRSRSVLAARRWKADLMIVDYGQLLVVPKAKNAIEAAPRQAETLRHIARDYCRTLALVQLRRTPPNDLNRYPDIEDIFGASQWEQAAQIILLLHRTRENKEYTGEDFCFLGKMREGQWLRPFGIRATEWGEFEDRNEGDGYGPEWSRRRL